ncbi:MAG: FkbM family methyltransferase [Candidatus Aminicenantia bacterium]
MIKELEKKYNLVKNKSKLIIINIKQKFPLKLGKWNIWLDKENSIASLDSYTEIFREKHHTLLPNFPRKKDLVIIDLGASDGFYTLRAREMAPKSKIISVEPNPSGFSNLKRNLKANKVRNVIPVNKVVTSKNGKISFKVVRGAIEIGGVKIFGDRGWLDKKSIKKISVDSITLETLCKKYKIKDIDLLKMDVEGNELDILKSSKKVLERVRKVIIEYHGKKIKKEVKKFMLKRNFKILLEEKGECGDIYFIKTGMLE